MELDDPSVRGALEALGAHARERAVFVAFDVDLGDDAGRAGGGPPRSRRRSASTSGSDFSGSGSDSYVSDASSSSLTNAGDGLSISLGSFAFNQETIKTTMPIHKVSE